MNSHQRRDFFIFVAEKSCLSRICFYSCAAWADVWWKGKKSVKRLIEFPAQDYSYDCSVGLACTNVRDVLGKSFRSEIIFSCC
jgi:hypothetical protein